VSPTTSQPGKVGERAGLGRHPVEQALSCAREALEMYTAEGGVHEVPPDPSLATPGHLPPC
jgi:hypothetical protein